MSDLERIRPDLVLGRRPPEVEPELAAAREAWAEIVGETAAASSYPARVSGDAPGVQSTSSPTPATRAGIAVMSTDDG